MVTLKIKGEEYKLKFGYKSFKNSKILREVEKMQRQRTRGEDKEGDEESEEKVDFLEKVLDLNSKLVLIALQKNHEEYRVDLVDEQAVKAAIEKVDDLLDDYLDEEDAMPIMDLFNKLLEELFEGGFLSKKSEKLEEAAEKTDATIIPMDHKLKEN